MIWKTVDAKEKQGCDPKLEREKNLDRNVVFQKAAFLSMQRQPVKST